MNQRNKNEKYQFLLIGVLIGAAGYYYYNKEKTPVTPPSGGGAGQQSLTAGSGGSCGCRASSLMITPVVAGIRL